MHCYSLFVLGNVSNSITGFNPFFCWICHYLSSNKLIMHCFSLLVDVSFSKTSAPALCIGLVARRMCHSLKLVFIFTPLVPCHDGCVFLKKKKCGCVLMHCVGPYMNVSFYIKISIYALFCGPMVNAPFSKDSFHTYCFGIFLEDVSLS